MKFTREQIRLGLEAFCIKLKESSIKYTNVEQDIFGFDSYKEKTTPKEDYYSFK